MPTRYLTVIGLLSLVLGAACASGASAPSTSQEKSSSAAKPATSSTGGDTASAPQPAAQRAPASGAAPADAAGQNLPSVDRMIIRTASMTIGVANIQEAYQLVERIALEQGGLIAGSQMRQEGERTTASVTVRVPADPATYQMTLERLRGIAERVVEEQAQAQDITEEYVDLESRIRNLRATEDSLLTLLARAQRVEDILPIQRELTTVRGQIEQAQGRSKALERRSEMATITLQIREQAGLGRGGWNPGETFAQALRALAATALALLTFAIWLLVWSPLWGPTLLLLWLLKRYARSVREARRLRLDPPRATAPSSGGGAA